MREAAALPLSVITAWEGLVDRAGVYADQQVLIHAGAGGVGQHRRSDRAGVRGGGLCYCVCRDKRSIVEALRRDTHRLPLDLLSTNTLPNIPGVKGFDIVYDTVGGATLDASFAAVKRYSGSCVELPGVGRALAGSALVSRSHVFRRLHPASAPQRRWSRSSWRRSLPSQAAMLAESGKLKPLLNERRFSYN